MELAGGRSAINWATGLVLKGLFNKFTSWIKNHEDLLKRPSRAIRTHVDFFLFAQRLCMLVQIEFPFFLSLRKGVAQGQKLVRITDFS